MATKGIVLSQTTFDYLMRAAERVYGLHGPGITNGPSGISITPPPARQQPGRSDDDSGVTVKITSAASGGGQYNGRILTGQSTADGSGDLALPEGMTVPDADDCLVINLSESVVSGHEIANNSFRTGRVVGVTTAGLRIVVVSGGGGSATFAVKVEKTGGSDGTSTTAASWTYTVKDLAGTSLGTAVAQSRPRPNGKMTFQTGSSGYGTAFYDGATLKLWDAGEVEGTGAC
jgi:hypothetical protein